MLVVISESSSVGEHERKHLGDHGSRRALPEPQKQVASRSRTFNSGGGRSHADLAWQIIAGTDYYWNPKFSTFIEYKFLNYTSTQINTNESRNLGQQLLGAGVRVHF